MSTTNEKSCSEIFEIFHKADKNFSDVFDPTITSCPVNAIKAVLSNENYTENITTEINSGKKRKKNVGGDKKLSKKIKK